MHHVVRSGIVLLATCVVTVASGDGVSAQVASAGAASESPGTGDIERVDFDRFSPLAASDEIVRRTSSPIAAARVGAYLRDHAQHLPAQGIDLRNEHFWLYVPKGDAPKNGYGLLVFIPPWEDGSVPADWRRVFDRHGLIYVSAERSGNAQEMLWRRIPLALHAYANVATRYRLDPDRIYVSGFSGGSRTALRVALAYPDVFRAAVLNAGADPFGEPGFPLPPPELFRLFQERSRLITISGTDDANIVARDAALSDSARRWCVVGIERQPMLQTGHEMMRASMLDHAIDAIERPESDASRHAQALAACRARVDAEMAKALDEVRVLLAQGKRKQAGEALSKIDGTYSGLAAPALRELAQPFIAK